MDEDAARAYVEQHIDLLNEGVRTQDFSAFLDTFADDAVMRFEGVPAGPFIGRAAVGEAYRDNPPDDTMRLTSIRPTATGTLGSFEWEAGGSGFFILETRNGKTVRLDVSFLPEAQSAWGA
jgi:hypothetical protein